MYNFCINFLSMYTVVVSRRGHRQVSESSGQHQGLCVTCRSTPSQTLFVVGKVRRPAWCHIITAVVLDMRLLQPAYINPVIIIIIDIMVVRDVALRQTAVLLDGVAAGYPQSSPERWLSCRKSRCKGAITSKIKHAIILKTSPARLAQLLQPSLAFCSSSTGRYAASLAAS